MKRTLLCLLVFVSRAGAYQLVEDIPSIVQQSANQLRNYAQYISQTQNQLTQIANQVMALQRFGNPQYYVGLLHLSDFMATASALSSGIGNTLATYRQMANGLQALSYTGNGLYSNLTGMLDRYGNPVRYQTDAFRKFQSVNDMVESYTAGQRTYDSQMSSLQSQLATAMQNLNRASTQMETEKYAAQINGIHSEINALGHTTNLEGQRVWVGQLANQNDAARMLEAQRQQQLQERSQDLQNEAHGFSRLIGGAP
jgi:hypothetical protein